MESERQRGRCKRSNNCECEGKPFFCAALTRGILCNALVCLAIWLCYSARTLTDKILAILFPITAFVAAGFEHSVANMYFIPMGILLAGKPAVLQAANLTPAV